MKKLILIIGLLSAFFAAEAQKYAIGAVTDTGFVRVLSNGRTVALTAAQMAVLLGVGGGIADGDKGDITVSGSGSTWTIDNNVVTLAKMQDIATDRLLGRDAAGSGDPAEIALNATLEWTGSNSIQRAALTGDVTASAGSNTTAIAAGVIVDADISASAAIALSKLATQAALSVVANGTNSTAVPTAIAAANDGEVLRRSGTALAFGTVATAGIADGAITNAKVTDVAASKLTSGTLPTGFTFGTTAASSARFNYSGGNPALIVNNSSNETSIFSPDGEQYFTNNNTKAVIGSGTSKMEYQDGALRLFDSDATNSVTFQTPATGTLTANYTLTLPADDGTANQVLTTNGTGTLSWTTPSGGGGGSPSVLSFSQFTSDQDNLTASGIADATVLRVSGNNSIVAITSIDATGMADGKEISIVNTGSQPIILQAEHPDGTSTNRFSGNGDVILAPRSNLRIVRDATSGRFWLPSIQIPQGLRLYKREYGGFGASITAADWGNIQYPVANSGSSIVGTLSSVNKPPGVQLTTSTNSAGSAAVVLTKSTNALHNPGDAHTYFKAIIQTPAQLSDATDSYHLYGGWMQNTTNGSVTNSQQSVFVGYTHSENGGKWVGVTRTTSGVQTYVDLGVTVAVNTAYTWEIYWNKANNEVRFFLDGEYKGRSTTNIPNSTNGMIPSIGITKNLGTTARIVTVTGAEIWMLFPY